MYFVDLVTKQRQGAFFIALIEYFYDLLNLPYAEKNISICASLITIPENSSTCSKSKRNSLVPTIPLSIISYESKTCNGAIKTIKDNETAHNKEIEEATSTKIRFVHQMQWHMQQSKGQNKNQNESSTFKQLQYDFNQ
jgi:hypothetical protein